MAAVYPAGPEPMITTFSTPRAGTGMGGDGGGSEAGLGDGDWGWDAVEGARRYWVVPKTVVPFSIT